jgi:hypothetical protein
MKQKFIFIILFIVTIGFNSTIHAQFNVESQIRNRFEYRDGYQKMLPDTAQGAAFMSQRTRLAFIYVGDKIKVKFVPQDVRIWGDEKNTSLSGSNGDDASLDVFEAYAEIKLCKTSSLSIGRQELAYDNQSILSSGNWNQNGISSDALVYKFDTAGWKLNIAASWNSLIQASKDNFYKNDRYKTLDFLWIQKKISENFKISFIQIASGQTHSDTTNVISFRHTTGTFLTYGGKNLGIWGDFYYQYGKNISNKSVSAYMADAEVNYKISKFTIGAGASCLSGNSKTGADLTTDNLFDPLYRSRHTFFGFNDYYSKFGTDTKEGGIYDYYGYLDYKLTKSLEVRNIVHYFQLNQTNNKTPTDAKLGYENDLVLKYKFMGWGSLEIGYLATLPTESLKTLQGVKNPKSPQFFYMQLTLTPTLFKQK